MAKITEKLTNKWSDFLRLVFVHKLCRTLVRRATHLKWKLFLKQAYTEDQKLI